MCSYQDVSGSGDGDFDYSGKDETLEIRSEPDTCLVLYWVVETVHASIFIFLAVCLLLMNATILNALIRIDVCCLFLQTLGFILSLLLLCSKKKRTKYLSYEDIENDDDCELLFFINLCLLKKFFSELLTYFPPHMQSAM